MHLCYVNTDKQKLAKMKTIAQAHQSAKGHRNTNCPICGKRLKNGFFGLQIGSKFYSYGIKEENLPMPEGAKMVYIGDICYFKLDTYKPAN